MDYRWSELLGIEYLCLEDVTMVLCSMAGSTGAAVTPQRARAGHGGRAGRAVNTWWAGMRSGWACKTSERGGIDDHGVERRAAWGAGRGKLSVGED